MNKVALITGATDGIGKAIALNLAKEHYSIHVIGRNEQRGHHVIEQLKNIYPEGNHQLFLFDLGEVDECTAFTQNYINHYSKLDLLILNANIAPKKVTVNSQNYDSIFMIGYISRYILTTQLEPLLNKSHRPGIIHINSLGMEKYTQQIDLQKIKNPNYSLIKAFNQCYKLSTHMVLNNRVLGYSTIPSMVFDPLGVLTNQILDRGKYFTAFIKLTGGKSPEEIGSIAVRQIRNFIDSGNSIAFFRRHKTIKSYTPTALEIKHYQEVIKFSEEITHLKYNPIFNES